MQTMNIRPFDTTTDYPPLLRLYRSAQADEGIQPVVTEEMLRSSTRGTRYVMEDPYQPAELIAAGLLAAQSPARSFVYLLVHPARRREKLGTLLLAYLQVEAAAQGARELAASLQATETVAQAFVRSQGFELAGHDYSLYLPAGVDPGEPAIPTGFVVRTFSEVNDLDELADAHNRCFGDRFGHSENSQPTTPDRLREWMERMPEGFMPDGIIFLYAPNGALAGLSYGRVSKDRQRMAVDSPSCTPEYRHQGLERPLTQLAASWLRQNFGPGPLALDVWGEFAENLGLYQDLGFTLAEQDHGLEFRKPVNCAEATGGAALPIDEK